MGHPGHPRDPAGRAGGAGRRGHRAVADGLAGRCGRWVLGRHRASLSGARPAAAGRSAIWIDCHTWPYHGEDVVGDRRRHDGALAGPALGDGLGVDDGVGPVADPDELEPLAGLQLDVGGVLPERGLAAELRHRLPLLLDLGLQGAVSPCCWT